MGSNPTSSAKGPNTTINVIAQVVVFESSRPSGRCVAVVSLPSIVVARRRKKTAETVDASIGRLALAHHGVFSRAQALRSGATDAFVAHRLSTGRWTRLHHGVYGIVGVPPSWKQRVMAAILAGGPGAVASYRCAARLWDLPCVIGFPIPEMTVMKGRGIPRSGAIVHETRHLPRADIAIVDVIPVTSIARTLIDVASFVSLTILEEALDDALRRSLLSLPRLRWRMREIAVPGRAGSGRLWGLVEDRSGRDPNLGSVLERRLLRLLTRAGFPAPVRQHEVRVAGRVVARVDFAYPDARLAVEVDGYRYHSGRVQWQRDLTRRNALTSLGWRVIQVTADDLASRSEPMLHAIKRVLDETNSRVR